MLHKALVYQVTRCWFCPCLSLSVVWPWQCWQPPAWPPHPRLITGTSDTGATPAPTWSPGHCITSPLNWTQLICNLGYQTTVQCIFLSNLDIFGSSIINKAQNILRLCKDNIISRVALKKARFGSWREKSCVGNHDIWGATIVTRPRPIHPGCRTSLSFHYPQSRSLPISPENRRRDHSQASGGGVMVTHCQLRKQRK